MPPNPSVPDIPPDWAERESDGTPYLLGIAVADTAWRPTIVPEAVTDLTGHLVKAANGRPVFVM